MMNKTDGFTLLEAMIVLAILAIVALIGFAFFSDGFINSMGKTEKRGKENLAIYLQENGLDVSRSSCSGDSDGDGYASCSATTTDGEKVLLQCPSDWWDVRVTGATGCKEISARGAAVVVQ